MVLKYDLPNKFYIKDKQQEKQIQLVTHNISGTWEIRILLYDENNIQLLHHLINWFWT